MGEASGRPTLGQTIRGRRMEKGWSQEELAARVGQLGSDLRQSDISRLELDKIGLPHRRRLEHLATALDLPLGMLLARSGWAGAEAAFTARAAPTPTPTEREPPHRSPASPCATAAGAGPFDAGDGFAALRLASDEARQTLARSQEILRACRETAARWQQYDLPRHGTCGGETASDRDDPGAHEPPAGAT